MSDAEDFARRSFRGHLGRLKVLGQTNSAIMQHVLGIEQSAMTLFGSAAKDDVEGDTQANHGRDPAHFKANGRNLSDTGRAFIFSLFDAGFSIRGAAARVGISLKAAADYRSAWLRHGVAQIS